MSTDDAETQWMRDKLQTQTILSMHGKHFYDELPAVLVFWFLNEMENGIEQSKLAFSLLRSLAEANIAEIGNDVHWLLTLQPIIREVNAVDDATLSERYKLIHSKLKSKKKNAKSKDDVSQVDQILIPLLCGGSVPLTVVHADEVRKYVERDDSISASKMLSVYSAADAALFSLHLSGNFQFEKLMERVASVNRSQLYKAMLSFGCLGPAVYSSSVDVHLPRGFSRVKEASLAYQYAMFLENQISEEGAL